VTYKVETIVPPTTKEKVTLRAMILLGVVAAIFFVTSVLDANNIGDPFLYTLLIITLLYYTLKILHEWYHYFSISYTAPPLPYKVYTVDILTTYCAGEPLDMLEQTLTAITKINYPHTAWCCDEADDPQVRAICKRLGVRHVTRTLKINAKAGNINNALQQATGELCVVLDPDHIPAPELLDKLTGYFNNPKVGLVQMIQAYYNQRESFVAKGAAQQTYQFYGPMMMCMHTYGTVQSIGANCVFRRAALNDIGGHAAGLSEDMHTAMQMHAKGWESVYYPAILTLGLVPATMSSYYKQQLKWARGTWELLMVVYPRLFTKFNWRQKLHYGTLPFHYLCGIIFFLNFLIPVFSLCSGKVPLQMDVYAFGLSAFPLFGMSVLIRHYVQKWVAQDTERGFHLVGGILQIGTWWIYSIGLVYTFLRKKIPYIPTPKNDHDKLPFSLSLPNLFIIVVSAAAILYGVTQNFNPYTIFMAVLASLQILFMIIIMYAAGHLPAGVRTQQVAQKIRTNTWLIKQAHGALRNYAVSLALIMLVIFIYSFKKMRELPDYLPRPLKGLEQFYWAQLNQPPGNTNTYSKQQKTGLAPAMVQINAETGNWPAAAIAGLYKQQIIPILRYTFTIADTGSVYQNISGGKFDSNITRLARQVAALQEPVFIRPVFNTAFYCGRDTLSAPDQFVKAWQHIHQLFENQGADKALWMWDAGGLKSGNQFFPGASYTDWIIVNIGSKNIASQPKGIIQDKSKFYYAYKPFHIQKSFAYKLPVLLQQEPFAHNNTYTTWQQDVANDIAAHFTDIKAIAVGAETDLERFAQAAKNAWQTHKNYPFSFNSFGPGMATLLATSTAASSASRAARLPDVLKTVVYNKGYNWFRNRHTLNKSMLDADIAHIKNIGATSVERTLGGFYDKQVYRALKENGLTQIGQLNTFVGTAELDDTAKMQKEKDRIVRLVSENINNSSIIAWNLGEDMLYNLENETVAPAHWQYFKHYASWLNEVSIAIKAADPVRPIITDLMWTKSGKNRLAFYQKYAPAIDVYMLTAHEQFREMLAEPLPQNCRWGKVPAFLWPKLPAVKKSVTLPEWQDLENTDFISLNGILDLEGRKKQDYRHVLEAWNGQKIAASSIPAFSILRPASNTTVNKTLTYSAIVNQQDGNWQLWKNKNSPIKLAWYLVRTNQSDNTMFIKKIGTGSSITFAIPGKPMYYRLYLSAALGDDVFSTQTTLHTPLED
jgi:cellulose synthase (UDP-forming)